MQKVVEWRMRGIRQRMKRPAINAKVMARLASCACRADCMSPGKTRTRCASIPIPEHRRACFISEHPNHLRSRAFKGIPSLNGNFQAAAEADAGGEARRRSGLALL